MASEAIPPAIAAIEQPRPELLHYYVLKALATTVAFPITMPLLYFRYHTMRYRFDAEGIHMKWGILMRHEIMLNYSRIQDIQLRANVIERWFGLARIEVQTASGSAGSELTIEGLDNFDDIRDFLYSRMRGARHHDVAASGGSSDSLADILAAVAGELRQIRQAIDGGARMGDAR
jgi:putative membrane protein